MVPHPFAQPLGLCRAKRAQAIIIRLIGCVRIRLPMADKNDLAHLCASFWSRLAQAPALAK